MRKTALKARKKIRRDLGGGRLAVFGRAEERPCSLQPKTGCPIAFKQRHTRNARVAKRRKSADADATRWQAGRSF